MSKNEINVSIEKYITRKNIKLEKVNIRLSYAIQNTIM